jgi:hypothetical protein
MAHMICPSNEEAVMTKRNVGLLITLILLLSAVFGVQASVAKDGGRTILEFDTLVGVPKPYTGAANAIRTIPGGGAPWAVVGSAKGELKQSGELKIEVRGLVLDPNDPVLIANGRAGTNPIPIFKAIVSCQSIVNNQAQAVNVSTGEFPATTGPASAGGGNAEIEAKLDLPRPCIAPIVFVTNAGGAWFAATGF